MDWIQQWQSKLNKQNGVAPLVRTGGSRHTGLAALPHRNIQSHWKNGIMMLIMCMLCFGHSQNQNSANLSMRIKVQAAVC